MQSGSRIRFSMTAVLVEQAVSLSPGHHRDLWAPSPDHSIHFDLTTESGLSPSTRLLNGSTGSLVDMITTPPSHASPQHYSPEPEGCSNANWILSGIAGHCEYQAYVDTLHHPYPGDRSPDSGISVYSPRNSPCQTELDPHFIESPASTIATTLSHNHQTPDLVSSAQQPTSSCISFPITTTTSIAQHHQQPMVYPPTSMMPGPYDPLPYELQTSFAPPPTLLPAPFSDPIAESMDPIKILAEDRVTGNTIQYYSDNHLPPASVAEFPSQQFGPLGDPNAFPGSFHPEFPVTTQHNMRTVGRSHRPRKQKVPAEVDTSEIKDIPASAQLWEFLLKVIKKPKYSYMVSWENQKDGLFRFHDPAAFAALWGRHRNRPSMTYDKVARALRYYYKRDILEQVGGRLTYKFSKRLQKQFMDCEEQ